ncbi:peptidoglycan/xylan/chitin deacetylase (PgdA/CDA1 family) [Sphingomonas naasensis]|uniref:Chitooligosaccharide deacetylase n=1 Tax=Sphingomonas naasensis TaxID=1344951 RepID=A0A4S1W8M3_9SPHN|nr:polysaccharide deacetylase family protein [Sphingomonas naasensis]NIJ19509.1 peptidoglycan/xylan/chitin deacetylase (PgdA/CDA1 family) [Sphingomonas naasensis]TGX39244.1 polysaccharide deacetylase [Sphingomonas naasensis]
MIRSLATLAALLLLAFAPAANAQKRIALTFDDTPRGVGAFFSKEERAKRLIAGLKKARVRQAAFFVNPGKVASPADAALVDGYVRAGHVIADHGFSHLHLNQLSAADYLADIDKAETWLAPRPGRRPWFRYPFLDEGGKDKARRDAVRAGLAARGLTNGYVTAEGSDWNMEQLAIDAEKAGKTIDMAALRDLYVETHVEAADFADALMVRTIGRSPPHVMLLHETDIAALYIADLVKALRADGWEIVTADVAYADPLRTAAPDVPSANGTLTELLAWEKGLPAPRWYERNDIKLANALFAERVLHEAPAP